MIFASLKKLYSPIFFMILMVGCAASIQLSENHSRHFSICDAAKFDSKIDLETEKKCWATWLRHYTSEQPQERIEYAETRFSEIKKGTAKKVSLQYGSTDSSSMSVIPEKTDDSTKKLPAPPKTETQNYCSPICTAYWYQCLKGKPEDASTKICVAEYRVCSRGCF